MLATKHPLTPHYIPEHRLPQLEQVIYLEAAIQYPPRNKEEDVHMRDAERQLIVLRRTVAEDIGASLSGRDVRFELQQYECCEDQQDVSLVSRLIRQKAEQILDKQRRDLGWFLYEQDLVTMAQKLAEPSYRLTRWFRDKVHRVAGKVSPVKSPEGISEDFMLVAKEKLMLADYLGSYSKQLAKRPPEKQFASDMRHQQYVQQAIHRRHVWLMEDVESDLWIRGTEPVGDESIPEFNARFEPIQHAHTQLRAPWTRIRSKMMDCLASILT